MTCQVRDSEIRLDVDSIHPGNRWHGTRAPFPMRHGAASVGYGATVRQTEGEREGGCTGIEIAVNAHQRALGCRCHAVNDAQRPDLPAKVFQCTGGVTKGDLPDQGHADGCRAELCRDSART